MYFNSQLHAGADILRGWFYSWLGDFNSQLHAGADIYNDPFFVDQNISIHSSTQELTHHFFLQSFKQLYFNSQLHAGADVGLSLLDNQQLNFNSQLHAGADLILFLNFCLRSYFNSQLHAGADFCNHLLVFCPLISIHSSTQELTTRWKFLAIPLINFNSQLHAGADLNWAWQILQCTISIHSSTQELTLFDLFPFFRDIFQFTAPRRSWRIWHRNNYRHNYNFNSQLHAGADISRFLRQYRK